MSEPTWCGTVTPFTVIGGKALPVGHAGMHTDVTYTYWWGVGPGNDAAQRDEPDELEEGRPAEGVDPDAAYGET